MTENVAEAKRALRSKLLSQRSHSLAQETTIDFGRQLSELVENLNPQVLGIYLSFGTEPGTWSFVDSALAKGISVACPRTLEAGQMEFVRFEGETEKNTLGFEQPVGEKVSESDLELLIIPALAVDLGGRRLGRGGGYFDRFLPRINCPIAAVVFDSEVLESLPAEPHDVAIDYAVTPSRVIRF
jgi:5-formyltetrahydrofolate cyclo-ligase